jgi:holin-like protein
MPTPLSTVPSAVATTHAVAAPLTTGRFFTGITIRSRHAVRNSRLLQIALIFAFWLLGEAIVRAAHVPLPGGIIGMAIVFGLLATHRISLHSMRRGAQWYLAEMLLFFVPAVLAVLNHSELFGMLGVKVLVVILGSTASVIAVTALIMDVFVHFRSRHDVV